jgi:hypothetical protein
MIDPGEGEALVIRPAQADDMPAGTTIVVSVAALDDVHESKRQAD